MSLSDIFSIPFLICLSICILLIGCSSIYFYQKMSQQDHKISSMVSLISSLAEESQQNNNTHGGFIPSLPPVAPAPASSSNNFLSNHLIHVSDDEEEDSESESESESDSSDSESDGSESDGSESDGSESSDSDDEKSVNDVKTITILSEDLAKEDNTNTIIFEVGDVDEVGDDIDNLDNIDNLDDNEDDNSLFEMDELQFEAPDSVVSVVNAEKGEINVEEHAAEDIKSIYLDQPSVDEITDFSIFKTINISSLDESVNNVENNNNSKIFETSDYKKMSITRLREIISKQGVSDASKLKKSDILKMLGVE